MLSALLADHLDQAISEAWRSKFCKTPPHLPWGHRKVCIQNYRKEGQGILNGFGFLRTDFCPTGIHEKHFDAMARLQKAVCRFEISQSIETDKETI